MGWSRIVCGLLGETWEWRKDDLVKWIYNLFLESACCKSVVLRIGGYRDLAMLMQLLAIDS